MLKDKQQLQICTKTNEVNNILPHFSSHAIMFPLGTP